MTSRLKCAAVFVRGGVRVGLSARYRLRVAGGARFGAVCSALDARVVIPPKSRLGSKAANHGRSQTFFFSGVLLFIGREKCLPKWRLARASDTEKKIFFPGVFKTPNTLSGYIPAASGFRG